ncbi:MAG: RNA pseudouridine synthase, partial [Candidatus Woesearchaeota archaeon]
YVKFELETGRTHQIRVHSKYIKHPVVNDDKYGYKEKKFKHKKMMLHAYKIEFNHPITKKPLTFEVNPPESFQKSLTSLRHQNKN